jgi:putative peptidoglycan lipid II flippase
VLFVTAGDLLVGALLQRGAFDRADTLLVWAVIAAYGLGLVAATAARLLQSALYGIGDTATPARASLVRVAVSLVIGVVLMLQLDRVVIGGGIDGSLPALTPVDAAIRERADAGVRLGAAGLALGSAAAAWVELRILRIRLQRLTGPIDITGGAGEPTVAAALAAVAATVVARLVLDGLGPLPRGLVALTAAGVVYLVTTRLMGFPVVRALHGRRPPPPRSATGRRFTGRGG